MDYLPLVVKLKACLNLAILVQVWMRRHNHRVTIEVTCLTLLLVATARVLVPQRSHDRSTASMLNISRKVKLRVQVHHHFVSKLNSLSNSLQHVLGIVPRFPFVPIQMRMSPKERHKDTKPVPRLDQVFVPIRYFNHLVTRLHLQFTFRQVLILDLFLNLGTIFVHWITVESRHVATYEVDTSYRLLQKYGGNFVEVVPIASRIATPNGCMLLGTRVE